MTRRSCTISLTDHEGFRHSVEVLADSLYEAVALAARAFRGHIPHLVTTKPAQEGK